MDKALPIDEDQSMILVELIKPYPEFLPQTEKIPLWELLNCMMDMLTGKRLGLKVVRDTQVIHSVVILDGYRKPPEEESRVEVVLDDDDDEEEEEEPDPSGETFDSRGRRRAGEGGAWDGEKFYRGGRWMPGPGDH